MTSLEKVSACAEAALRANLTNPSLTFWVQLHEQTKEVLAETRCEPDATAANRAWFVNRVAQCYRSYVECFEQMRAGAFYDAWCGLERIEIALPWLLNNPFLDPNDFHVTELQARVVQWQSLYPYKVFFSPGFIHKKKECSICHTAITPWEHCEHEIGKVYAGEECACVVTMSAFVEISLVLDPVQKYSVAMAGLGEDGKRQDHHDHSIARFLVERLSSPFDKWSAEWTEALHPHAMFPDVTPDGACPCGSGRTYQKCCLPRRGVIRPHVQFRFEKMPPRELPEAAFAGYGDRNGPAALKLPPEMTAK